VEKYYHDTSGYSIERAENRGITIKQLEIVVEEMEALFKAGEYYEKTKTVDEVSISDIYTSIIKKRTESLKISYVERVASKEQRPSWCVCFIWYQPIKGMLDILRQHSKDRDLSDSDSYWINVSQISLLYHFLYSY